MHGGSQKEVRGKKESDGGRRGGEGEWMRRQERGGRGVDEKRKDRGGRGEDRVD